MKSISFSREKEIIVRRHSDDLFRFSYQVFKIKFVVFELVFLALSLYGLYQFATRELGLSVPTATVRPIETEHQGREATRSP